MLGVSFKEFEMLRPGVPSLDQLAVFLTVVESGSFAAAGAAVLSEARSVSVGVDNLRAKAKGLLEGLEAEIALVVDVMLPTARLVDAMQAFGATFPTVTLRLYVEALGAVTQLVHSGIADIGISGVDVTLPGIERIKARWCGTDPRSGAEPPIGDGLRACAGSSAGLCPTRAHRSLYID
jgi:DNA-binding transcriptional LysR family regulator